MKSEDISHFCQLCLSRTLSNYNVVIPGSLSELPLQFYFENPSDMDIMSWHNDIHVFPEESLKQRQFTGHAYKIETFDSPAGFAKIVECDSSGNWTYCGRKSRLADPNNGPAFTKIAVQFNDLQKFTTDLVIGLRYSVWPSNASEWKERMRSNGWPPNNIIEKIVSDGCHLVLKSHHSHPDDENEWRFSFSLAESTLARTWNDIQRYIYRTLRLIKCDVVEKAGGSESTILRTYHFKTLMFWACEEKPSSFWDETRIVTSVKELQHQMIEWLIDKRCPNYFIPPCNLFDCESIDTLKEISLLLEYTPVCTFNLGEQMLMKTIVRLHIPKKLMLISQMVFNCMNFVNPLKPNEVMFSPKRLAQSPLLAEELQWVHRAICLHRDICSYSCDGESRRVKMEEAKRCFSLAKEITMEDDKCPITFKLSENVYGIIEALCSNTSNNDYAFELNSLLNKYKLVDGMNILFDAVNRHMIRPSYLLTAAYEANFCYTVLHDYHRAKHICDDALVILDKQKYIGVLCLGSDWVNCFQDFLSIAIIDEWIQIFDDAIVTTIGFVALFNAVNTIIEKLTATSKTPIYFRELGCLIRQKAKPFIRLNPIHFLSYVRLQCSRLLEEPQLSFCIESSDFLTICVNVSYRMQTPQRFDSCAFG